jgi:hypothetical protein
MLNSQLDDDSSLHYAVSEGSEAAEQREQHQNRRQSSSLIASKETNQVWCLRIALLTVLLIVAISFAVLVHAYTSKNERDEYEDTMHQFAKLIQTTVLTTAQNRLESVGSLATAIQAHAVATSAVWPFVTVPFFEERVDTITSLTGAYKIVFFPIVSHNNKDKWERYSVNHRGWINDSYVGQEALYGSSDYGLPASDESYIDFLWGPEYYNVSRDGKDGVPNFESGISDSIFTSRHEGKQLHVVTEQKEYYIPQWQAAPIDWYYWSSINLDYTQFQDFAESTTISMDTGAAVLGEAWADAYTPGFISTMIFPIYKEFHTSPQRQQQQQQQQGGNGVVGFLGADIYWGRYLTKILPENARGVYVVIENTIQLHVMTYQIFGDNATFVGEGDLHERKYDDQVESFRFGEQLYASALHGSSSSSSSSFYTGTPLYDGFIQYTFHIYPSEELERQYVTRKPVLYTIVTLVIFSVTSLFFVLYDCLVERRQKLMMNRAVVSDAIVSSLFPRSVKSRLYGVAGGDVNNNGNRRINHHHHHPQRSTDPSKVRFDQPLPVTHEVSGHGQGDPSEVYENDEHETRPISFSRHQSTVNPTTTATATTTSSTISSDLATSPPIADLYTDTTILFADIVGFTAWSSTRPPVDVFRLLESVYGAFDEIAERRGVFKVETIGGRLTKNPSTAFVENTLADPLLTYNHRVRLEFLYRPFYLMGMVDSLRFAHCYFFYYQLV